MNWKQLHTSATPEERLELLLHMLQTIEARQRRLVFTGHRWVRNRRGHFPGAHFLNDRRRHTRARVASLLTFVTVLVTVSAVTWAAALASPQSAGPILFFHITALLGVLAFKPNTLRMQPLAQNK